MKLTLSPFRVRFHDLVHVGHILEPLLLQLSDLVRVSSLVLSKQNQVQHHLSIAAPAV